MPPDSNGILRRSRKLISGNRNLHHISFPIYSTHQVPMRIVFELSSETTKRLLVLGTTLALLLGGTYAFAALSPFQDGETLSAQKLNGNFTELDSRLTQVEGPLDAYSEQAPGVGVNAPQSTDVNTIFIPVTEVSFTLSRDTDVQVDAAFTVTNPDTTSQYAHCIQRLIVDDVAVLSEADSAAAGESSTAVYAGFKGQPIAAQLTAMRRLPLKTGPHKVRVDVSSYYGLGGGVCRATKGRLRAWSVR
jgi:hypothetical protein